MSEPLWAQRDLSATVLFGISEGGPMSILFAATYPERTLALILAGAFARRAWPPDYPWGMRSEEIQKLIGRGRLAGSSKLSRSENRVTERS